MLGNNLEKRKQSRVAMASFSLGTVTKDRAEEDQQVAFLRRQAAAPIISRQQHAHKVSCGLDDVGMHDI